jgi:hypothetical protein
MDFGLNRRVWGEIRREGKGLMMEFGGRDLVSGYEEEKLLIGVGFEATEG